MKNEFFLMKFVIALIFLLFASKMDLKMRIVPNRVWKYMVMIFIPLDFFEVIIFNHSIFQLILAMFQISIVSGIAYLLYYIGAYGGADAKAIISLSIAFPFYPQFWIFPFFKGFSLAFASLSNSVIIAPFMALYFFARNVAKEGIAGFKNNILYYFTALRVDAENIPRFHNLLEYIDENGRLKRVKKGVEPNKEMLKRIQKAKKEGKIDKIWITPALPFIVFITIGYVLSVFVGDILFTLISHFIA